jgi:hypothetical protein
LESFEVKSVLIVFPKCCISQLPWRVIAFRGIIINSCENISTGLQNRIFQQEGIGEIMPWLTILFSLILRGLSHMKLFALLRNFVFDLSVTI